MNVVVFGAAGKTGRAVVHQAKAAGHTVTAFVRHAGDYDVPDVEVREGDAQDAAAVDAALAGQDAVIDTIGGKTPYKATTLESSAARTIIASMRRQGARRLVVTSMIGEGDSVANMPVDQRPLLTTFLRGATPDKARMEEAVEASDLDWVIVRPAILDDDPATGHVRVYTPETGDEAHRIAREDLASFLVAQLSTDEHLRHAVTIANG
ncbi:MAG: hypothetical protein AVDCRST_MAG12-2571 [uncultured Rubrobacteraceae bacterium]|uniref:NAD(P)-binding domain-containing protein n=1 Tax=uncultured Rubrobacteraceae bacterium TaxID=349277 RepID=A0A6J4SH01_9ACTN|nr:MAG: hypothetical protein AVDCRST_MAG12-2571 [uncultured Rubrobacteraceae bacterium]